MAKRRAVIESDDEQGDQEGSSSGTKRSRLEDQAENRRSSKSKGKARARDDNDILNDIRVDDDDDISAMHETRAVEDEVSQERFEEEHEESIRESIRQRTSNKGGQGYIDRPGEWLKAFIREGQPAAEVTINLKNQGEEAYKPDLYGDSIVITRRFSKEGASSYKIKSKDGRLISTKREELSAICDHMNIQVDNPMNFFLRGTQLSQLSEEYETCLENISQTSKVLMRKKEAIPDLQAHYKEVLTRFEEASKAREQRHKADELTKELAWAHVATKQGEVTEKATEVHKLEQRIPKIQRSLDGADSDEHSISENLKNTKGAMQQLESRMAAEKAKIAEYSQSKQDELSQRLQQAVLDIQAAEANLKQSEALVLEKKNEVDALRVEGDQVDREIEIAKRSVLDFREQIQRCVDQQNNSLAPYGRDLQKVLERIGRMKWHGQRPVGPLGVYVKVKDHLPILKGLLKESGNPNTTVFVSEVDLFDYKSGEPPPNYPTILRVINVSDEFVLRILINQAKIERILLAPTRKAADELLSGIERGGQCQTADLWRVQRWSDGGGQSQPMQSLRAKDPRNLLFTDQSAESQLRHWQERAASADTTLKTLTSRISELRNRFTQAQREVESRDRQCRDIHRQMNDLRTARDSLQTEANDNVLVETSGLDEALREMVAEKESLMAQYKSIAEQKAVINQAQEPLLKELNEVKKQIEEFDGRRQEAQARVTQAAEQRLTAQNQQQHWAKKLLEEEKKVREAREDLNLVQQEFENWTKAAEQICPRVENVRKAATVKRNLESVQAALKDREKQQGASVEEMAAEVNKARAALETAQKDLRSMASLNKALKQSLRLRLEKWHDFRRHIAFRCKVVFQYHLSNRGYFGKVLFNHHDGTLQLKVQTDDLNGTQGGNRDKDPRSLSGGEKSFATICLLLAMWESIGSPIRCLDEFDVFMDAVNRRISMKMMIDTANSSDGKQYILITPQNMQNIHVGPTVRVHLMPDPERGQGTLAGGTAVA
ncbi:hypothetical protein BGW80DRAFT_1274148 [Lactifluus volemus]|nr:hypothetical protein BGW80DRAFT_1274148 [Lactifluus volemus]